MSAKVRQDAEALRQRYAKAHGLEPDAVRVVLYGEEDGTETAAVGAEGHPVWTLAGKAPHWFVSELLTVPQAEADAAVARARAEDESRRADLERAWGRR